MDESSKESRLDRSRAPDAWRVMAASTRGIGHREKDEPCQDSHLVEWLDENGCRTLVLAVSDGAGSARCSHQGSQLAVRCFKGAIAELRRWNYQPSTITDLDIWRWVFLRVRLALHDWAMEKNAPVRDLACTLLATVIDEAGVICVQLGDGYILYGKEERYATVFKPVRGEFANETVFIVTPGAIDQHLQIARLSRMPERLVLMSDGLERVAIVSPAALDHTETTVRNDPEKYGYDRLFTPLFKRLMESQPGQHRPLSLELGEWMDQPRINQRTDDDKTLILAVATDAPGQPWLGPPSAVTAPKMAPSVPASESAVEVIDLPPESPEPVVTDTTTAGPEETANEAYVRGSRPESAIVPSPSAEPAPKPEATDEPVSSESLPSELASDVEPPRLPDTPSVAHHDSDSTSAGSSTDATTDNAEPSQSPDESTAASPHESSAESPPENTERDDRTAPQG